MCVIPPSTYQAHLTRFCFTFFSLIPGDVTCSMNHLESSPGTHRVLGPLLSPISHKEVPPLIGQCLTMISQVCKELGRTVLLRWFGEPLQEKVRH